jgi:ribonucleoside-diphosphate reductase beta chain
MAIWESSPYGINNYPDVFALYKLHQKNHWVAEEIQYSMDIMDWNTKLTDSEKEYLTYNFRFFTQADIDVANGYIEHFLPHYKNIYVRMALLNYASMEATHIESYAKIIISLNMPETEFTKFLEYKEMFDKHTYFDNFNMDTPLNVALTTGLYGAFAEGLQLFASFIMLLNFQRFNKMRAMCQVVAYSIRDEQIHVDSMIAIYHHFIRERIEMSDFGSVELDYLRAEFEKIARKVVELEDFFIDNAFKNFEIEGLTAEEVKSFIRYIANMRLKQLGFNLIYSNSEAKPLVWVTIILEALTSTNFFENRVTEYASNGVSNWDKIEY